MRAAVLPLLVLAFGLAASCGTRNEMAIVTNAGSSDAGPSWCRSCLCGADKKWRCASDHC